MIDIERNLFFSLVQDGGTIECLEQLKFYITYYYKDPFGTSEEGNFYLDESKTDDIPQVFDK
jgi:hypothetical protein